MSQFGYDRFKTLNYSPQFAIICIVSGRIIHIAGLYTLFFNTKTK